MPDRRRLLALLAAGLARPLSAAPGGRIVEDSLQSATLKSPLHYSVYLPPDYDAGLQKLPVLYLLHGRGDTLRDAWRCKPLLDELIAAGRIPPLLAVMPDAPWSQRGGYYVDSAHDGGAAIESALIGELLPHIDARYRTAATRESRLVGGYSMGAYGALRYALAHPRLFSAAIVMSPAVYTPLPPLASSTREFGAFGQGDALFVPERYRALNYPAALQRFAASGLRSRFFVLSGDDEYVHPDPADIEHDIDFEAHKLYQHLRRTPGIQAELRIVDGGHNWKVWLPGLRDGLLHLLGPVHTTGSRAKPCSEQTSACF